MYAKTYEVLARCIDEGVQRGLAMWAEGKADENVEDTSEELGKLHDQIRTEIVNEIDAYFSFPEDL